jgi:hypothetical protein
MEDDMSAWNPQRNGAGISMVCNVRRRSCRSRETFVDLATPSNAQALVPPTQKQAKSERENGLECLLQELFLMVMRILMLISCPACLITEPLNHRKAQKGRLSLVGESELR